MLKENPKKLLELAFRAAEEACRLILERLDIIRSLEKDWDGRGHPHTTLDVETDSVIHDILSGAGGAAYLSEERKDEDRRLECGLVWIVDPLDGTRNLLLGYRNAVVSIALVSNGVPMLGVIKNPFSGETFHAVKGEGAFLGGARISVSDVDAIEKARIVLSCSEKGNGFLAKYEKKIRFDTIGSCAYKMALVACGRYDLTFTERMRGEWDTAAGDVIVSEAGGLVTDFSGRKIAYNKKIPVVNGLICSNSAVGRGIRILL